MNNQENWVPEIFYEEADSGLTSNIPFIAVPEGNEMPQLLYIFESRETGEIEPGPEGEELPVTEIDLHQYADMAILKAQLAPEAYDAVRDALGLESLASASVKGHQITENIRMVVGESLLGEEVGSD